VVKLRLSKGGPMTAKPVSLLVLVALLLALPAVPLAAKTQNVAPAPAFTAAQANFCPGTAGAQVFAGGRFRYAGQAIYYKCWYVLGQNAEPAGVAWIPGEVRNNTFFLSVASATAGGQCTRPGNLRYSVGAVVSFNNSTYRCSAILAQELKAAGVAWVEVEVRDNNSFLIKGQP
jgi:hypothetical protein